MPINKERITWVPPYMGYHVANRMRYIYMYWPRKRSTHLKQKDRLGTICTRGAIWVCSREQTWPTSDSVGLCPFLITRSPFHTITPTASFHNPHFSWSSLSFLFPTLFPTFLSSSLLAAPALRTLGALAYGSQVHALSRFLNQGVGKARPQDESRVIDPCGASRACIQLRLPSPFLPKSPWCSPREVVLEFAEITVGAGFSCSLLRLVRLLCRWWC